MRAAACLFAGMALLACAPTKDARDPSYARWGHLERLAVAEPVLCSGSSLDSYVALDALKDQVAVTAGPWTAGRPSCAGLDGEAIFDPDDLSSPRMNAEGLQGLRVEGADVVLVTLVTVDESCEPGRTCSAEAMTLAAFLYDATGRMVWKSVTSRSLGFGFPAPSTADPRELLYARPRHPAERVVAAR